MSNPIRAHIDPEKLDAFLHHYFNTPLPDGSVSTILTEAFNALIGAGVVVVDEGPSNPDDQFYVHGGRVWLFSHDLDDKTDPPSKTVWTGEGLPSFDPAIQALAELLDAVLNSAPYDEALDFPHTRN